MNNNTRTDTRIKRLETTHEIEICAQVMANSEPWITLGRDYKSSIETLSVPSKEVYLAMVKEEIAGFTILNMQGGFIGYVQTLCVASEWRNKGIGSQLMSFAEQRIFKETPNVFICVSSFNPKALKFYQDLGYEVIGELKDYIVAGHSEILLRKSISPIREFHASVE